MAKCQNCGFGRDGIQRKEATVAYVDGHIEKYRITPIVEMKFERLHRKTIASLNNGSQDDAYQLVWEAMKFAKKDQVVPILENWLETVEAADIDMVDVVPIEPAQAAGTSPSSPSPSA